MLIRTLVRLRMIQKAQLKSTSVEIVAAEILKKEKQYPRLSVLSGKSDYTRRVHLLEATTQIS